MPPLGGIHPLLRRKVHRSDVRFDRTPPHNCTDKDLGETILSFKKTLPNWIVAAKSAKLQRWLIQPIETVKQLKIVEVVQALCTIER
jgi:hypothetical protein